MSNSKRPGGPGGPRGMRKGPKAKNPMKTLKRIFAIIVKGYPIQCVLVIIGIVVGVCQFRLPFLIFTNQDN